MFDPFTFKAAPLSDGDIDAAARARARSKMPLPFGERDQFLQPERGGGMGPPSWLQDQLRDAQGDTGAYQDGARTSPHAEQLVRNIGGVAGVAAEVTGIPQAFRTGRAYRDAYNEPSRENLTNAGVQTGFSMLPFSFGAGAKAAVGSLGAGYGTALADDLGFQVPSFMSAAHADTPDALDAGSRARLTALQKKQSSGATLTRAEREEQNAYIGIVSQAQTAATAAATAAQSRRDGHAADLDRQKKEAEQVDYNASVARADAAKAKELSLDRRFSETEVGKVWDKTGGFAPFIASAALGGLSRAATGGGSNLYNYGLPLGIGAVTGAATSNIPLAYNAFMTEPDNPEKRAYSAYARELPLTHPRRSEWQQYADNLPKENPVRTAAADELYDPRKAGERMLFGTLEGLAGGIAGADLVRMPRRLLGAFSETAKGTVATAAELPGIAAQRYHEGMGKAAVTSQSASEAQRLASQSRRSAAGEQQLAADARRDAALAQDRVRQAQQQTTQTSGGSGPAANQYQQRSPAPAQDQSFSALQLPPPGQGKWNSSIAPVARDILRIRADSNIPLGPLKGAEIFREIQSRLPSGVKVSPAEVRDRVSTLLRHFGDTNRAPTRAELDAVFASSPGSLLNGRKAFGVAPLAPLALAGQGDFIPHDITPEEAAALRAARAGH